MMFAVMAFASLSFVAYGAETSPVDCDFPADAPSPSYTALFRASDLVLRDAEAEALLWKALDAHPGAYEDISVHSQNNHSVRPLSHHRANIPGMTAFFAKARARGMNPGVDVLTTLGFTFTDQASPEMDGFPMAVNRQGDRVVGRLCPTAAETRSYVHDLYTLYAKCGPSFIWIDDDVSLSGACFCSNCVKRFAMETGLIAKGTYAELIALLESDDMSVRRAARTAWLGYNEQRVDEICAVVADAVYAVDPGISIGYMTCMSGRDGCTPKRWAKTLAHGGRVPVRWRPGGGHWTDESFTDLLGKVLRMQIQTFDLPAAVTALQSEVENFPYVLRKTPEHMGFESLLCLGVGMTGTAFNFCCFSALATDEFMPFFDRAASTRTAGETIVATLGRSPSEGIAFPWNHRSGVGLGVKGWQGCDIPQPAGIALVGLPVSSVPARAKAFLLNASLAVELDGVSITNILSKGVFLDAEALRVLNDRGFGSWTGFRVSSRSQLDAITRDLDHPLTWRKGVVRDIRSSFGCHGSITLLEKTTPDASFTEEAIDLDGRALGFAGGVYENAHGGRIAVGSMLPFEWAESRPRAVYLQRLFRWLSRNSLPAYIHSFHRAALFARNGCIFVANLAQGQMENAVVAALEGGTRRLDVFVGGVKVSDSELVPCGKDGAYFLYRLPVLPVHGEILLGKSSLCK